MKNQPDPLEIYISRLKIYISSLKIYISNLKIYISRLEIQFFHGVGKVLEAVPTIFQTVRIVFLLSLPPRQNTSVS